MEEEAVRYFYWLSRNLCNVKLPPNSPTHPAWGSTIRRADRNASPVRLCSPPAPSVSLGPPDACNPPGWCWRCRRRCPPGGSQPSGVADLADKSDRAAGLCPSPEQQAAWRASAVSGQSLVLRPLSPVHLLALPVARSSCTRRLRGLLGKCVKADAANEPAWMPGCKPDLIGAESRGQFGGLMKYCPDGNVMTQKGFYAVILHRGLSARRQCVTSAGRLLGSPVCRIDPPRRKTHEETEPSFRSQKK